jgi:alpha-beta hydrolase superfamily lysophospholipase
MNLSPQTFEARDGTAISYRRWAPSGDPSAIVVVAHGMSEHGGRYERLANELVARGWAVYAPDHRGHGATADVTGVGRAGPAGVAGTVDDLFDLIGLAHQESGDLPVVLLGHSMGAMLAQAFAVHHGGELAGLALSGSGGYADGLADLAAMMQGMAEGPMADEPVPMLPMFNAAFEPGRTDFDWLSRDEAEVDAYLADPMCGAEMPMTFGFTAQLMGLVVDAMSLEGIAALPTDLPVLLLTGEQDPASEMAVNVRALERHLQEAGLEVEAHYYPGARHEVFNETNRDEVTADLVTWIDGVLAASRPGV